MIQDSHLHSFTIENVLFPCVCVCVCAWGGGGGGGGEYCTHVSLSTVYL